MLCKELFHLQANLQKWMNSQKPWAEQAPVEEDLFALWPNIRSFHTLAVPTMIYDKHWKGLLPVELIHRWPRLPNTKSPSFVCVRDIKPQAPERLPQRVQWRAAVRRWCQLHSAGSLPHGKSPKTSISLQSPPGSFQKLTFCRMMCIDCIFVGGFLALLIS